MPQSSVAYAVGRVRAMELRLLDKNRFARLLEADASEALRLLGEMGYGAGVQADGDVEPLIQAELAAARAAVWEMTPDPTTTSLFLLKADAHNLKTLLKAKMLGVDAAQILTEGGCFPLEKLEKAVSTGSYGDLPEAFAQALRRAEAVIAKAPDPRVISAEVDRAVFVHVQDVLKKHKNAFAQSYFTAQADFTNVQSVIRARALGWDHWKLEPLLIPGGAIAQKDLLEALELPAEQLPRKLGKGPCGMAISRALEEYAQEGSARGVERRMDSALMTLVRESRMETFGLGPVIGYLLGRESEAKALRVLFAAKRVGITPELPELYA